MSGHSDIHERLVAVYGKLRKSQMLVNRVYTAASIEEFAQILATANFSDPELAIQRECMRRVLDDTGDRFETVMNFIRDTKQWHLCLLASGRIATEVLHVDKNKLRVQFDPNDMCYKPYVVEGKHTPDDQGFTRVTGRNENTRFVVHKTAPVLRVKAAAVPTGPTYADALKKTKRAEKKEPAVNWSDATNDVGEVSVELTELIDNVTDETERQIKWMQRNSHVITRLVKECQEWGISDAPATEPATVATA